MKIFGVLLFALLVSACGGGENSEGSNLENTSGDTQGDTQGNTSGVITLSGDDTTVVGTILDTGYIGASLAEGSLPDYIVIVDQSSGVTLTPPNVLTPNVIDPNNGFVLVVMDDTPGSGVKGISMSIMVDGTEFDYACTTPVSTFVECGFNSISLDIENKTVIFDNATVINTDTNTILTIDGTLTWSDSVGTGTGTGTGTVGNGVATELEGTWIDACREFDGVYETGSVTFSGNTFTYSGLEYSDSACTVVDGTYSSTATFTIGNSTTTSSGLSAKEIDITVLTIDGSSFTLMYYDIFRIDGDRLYFGDQGSYDVNIDDWEYNGLTIEKRPIDLDFSSYSTKE